MTWPFKPGEMDLSKLEEEQKLPVAFSFDVTFSGDVSIFDAAFREVSGLESSIEVETVVEGGENRFAHQLPKPVKHGNLKLVRAITEADGDLVKWCKKVFENDFSQPIETVGVKIDLLDNEGEARMSWSVANAFPVKWSIGGFDAMKNELAIETLELAYTTLKRS